MKTQNQNEIFSVVKDEHAEAFAAYLERHGWQESENNDLEAEYINRHIGRRVIIHKSVKKVYERFLATQKILNKWKHKNTIKENDLIQIKSLGIGRVIEVDENKMIVDFHGDRKKIFIVPPKK